MKLNIKKIATDLNESKEVVVIMDQLVEDMNVIHQYYLKSDKKPKNIKTYLKTNENCDYIKLTKLYLSEFINPSIKLVITPNSDTVTITPLINA